MLRQVNCNRHGVTFYYREHFPSASTFQPRAISSSTARGLGKVLRGTVTIAEMARSTYYAYSLKALTCPVCRT